METPFYKSIPAMVIGAALIISTIIGAATVYNVKSFDNTLSVTGSARKEISSDSVKWILAITRQSSATDLKTGHAQLSNDLVAVKAFLKQSGIEEKDLTISPVDVQQIYKQYDSSPREYTLRQTIQLNSTDIDKITNMSKNMQSLINQGVFVTTQSLEYYYTKLAELRVSLLADALKDAKARASTLAETSGKKIGQLKSAASGVVQVLPENSVEVADYGAYDTQSIKKQVMVTVKASFTLR